MNACPEGIKGDIDIVRAEFADFGVDSLHEGIIPTR